MRLLGAGRPSGVAMAMTAVRSASSIATTTATSDSVSATRPFGCGRNIGWYGIAWGHNAREAGGQQPVQPVLNSDDAPAPFRRGLQGDDFEPILIGAEDGLTQALADLRLNLCNQVGGTFLGLGLGRDADVDDAGVRRQANGGIAEKLQVADLLIDRAFSQSRAMQYPHLDPFAQVEALLQIRE